MHNYLFRTINFTLYHLVFYFVIYSFLGWIGEVMYAYKNQKKFVNRGFLHGPFCPMYGACMILIIILFSNFSHMNLFKFFIIATLLTSILEYGTGFILEKMFNQKWWDYTEDPLNLHGRICFHFSIMFGFLTTIGVKFVHPFINKLIDKIYPPIGLLFFYGLIIYFFIDLSITLSGLLQEKNAIN